ncbi:hypothetical protein [Neisseria sp. Ec49-e6-T10]|uniref:hypothetical protein n=1 Tax=Neisseria sp. Ec49-e6-T10 TaxID=3140744 RepID=UPI003EBA4F5F
MIRNGYYVLYKGKEYSINRGTTDKGPYFRLYSDTKEDLENGFEQYCYPEYNLIRGKKYISKLAGTLADYYFKDISSLDVEEVYRINTLAEYKNVTVAVIGENDTQYLLYIGDEIGNGLGFENIGRSEYQKWINKEDVVNVHEVKRPANNFFGS